MKFLKLFAILTVLALTKANAEPATVDCGFIMKTYAHCRDMPAQMACNEYYICAAVFKNLGTNENLTVCRTPNCGRNVCALDSEQACDARDNGAHPLSGHGY